MGREATSRAHCQCWGGESSSLGSIYCRVGCNELPLVFHVLCLPVCLYGTETLALTELQQQRLQMCENNWVRKIARVTRADRRRMVELREETGVQRSLTERLVRSRLQWAGHVERMADDRLPKRAAELCEQGRRRRGRPRLRWEDCDKKDVR